MPRQRSTPPATVSYANAPQVADQEVQRALDAIIRDIQALQKGQQAVLVDGSRPPALGDDATGDLWYRDRNGKLVRLPAGADGQVLTMVGGVPAWA
jgi:hypothetical protein